MDHRKNFLAFAKYEMLTGGPDSHLELAADIAKRSAVPAWFCGLYTIPYNVPSAEILAYHLPFPARITRDEAQDLWKLIVVRKERRVNGFGPAKLEDTINSLHDCLDENRFAKIQSDGFDQQFDGIKRSVRNHGRYFGIKFYECLRRSGALYLEPFDNMLPKDGQLSRKGLALLFPEHEYRAKDPFSCMEANELAEQLRAEVGADWFQIEALLCEYRQAVAGTQYPGRAHDSELSHLTVLQALNQDFEFQMLEARARLFPHWALGELNGWSGRRPLGHVMSDHGYVWTDSLYDYSATIERKEGFATPVAREEALSLT